MPMTHSYNLAMYNSHFVSEQELNNRHQCCYVQQFKINCLSALLLITTSSLFPHLPLMSIWVKSLHSHLMHRTYL